MRRIDVTETMEALARRDALTSEQALAAGARIARFHADAKPQHESTDYRELVDRNFEALLPLIEELVPARERLGLQRFAAGFLIAWAAILEARARAGSTVDGHGDLRPGNVVFELGRVLIVGRLEAGDLRRVDMADELGSLVTELAEITGDREAGDAVLSGYRESGGAAAPEALMAFFGAYRAQARARVMLQGSEGQRDSPTRTGDAKRLLARSGRLNWQARGPLILLVTGPSTSGKSTLAEALGSVSGIAVLALGGRVEHDRAEVARLAAGGVSLIIDDTFVDIKEQASFIELLSSERATQPLVVECRAPTAIRAARAHARRIDDPSDPVAPLAAYRQESFASIRGLPGESHLAVDTRAVIAAQVDEVTSWLDSVLAAGRC